MEKVKLEKRRLAEEAHRKEQEAASVAALINTKSSAAEAFATAGKHFRAWPLSCLTRDHFNNNEPDPTLHAMTIPAKLGDVSAFVSHILLRSATLAVFRGGEGLLDSSLLVRKTK